MARWPAAALSAVVAAGLLTAAKTAPRERFVQVTDDPDELITVARRAGLR